MLLLQRYSAAMMDPFLSLQVAAELLYFLCAAGEPVPLRHGKADREPGAATLRAVLDLLEGDLICADAVAIVDLETTIELRSGAAERAAAVLRDHPETCARLQKVADLIEGFETPYGIELLVKAHIAGGFRTTIAGFPIWRDQKLRLEPQHLRLAHETLHRKAW